MSPDGSPNMRLREGIDMFDLSFPALVERGLGNSVICSGAKHESCQIFVPPGFECLDLIRMWLAEASAVSRGAKKTWGASNAN